MQSIFAVQGLGAHPFYTWARKNPPAQKDKARGFWGRLTKKDKARGKVTEPGTESSSSAGLVMWPRDLLVPEFKNARIATYSYGSDWRNRDINTSLRECGQQFLEILLQHRWEASVGHHAILNVKVFSNAHGITGTTKAAHTYWTQSGGSGYPAGILHSSWRKHRGVHQVMILSRMLSSFWNTLSYKP